MLTLLVILLLPHILTLINITCRTVFTHELFLYQKSHSFAALTRSISDTSTTRAYARTFHEVFYIFWMAKIHEIFWETFLKRTIVN